VKTVAPLAAKTDKVDARLPAELCGRELVPALWLPSLDQRALRERLRRRLHPVRLRTSTKARISGLQTQWGVRVSLARLRRADGLTLLKRAGVPDVWRRSVSECLAVIDSSTPASSRSTPSPGRSPTPTERTSSSLGRPSLRRGGPSS
jgi:transposase